MVGKTKDDNISLEGKAHVFADDPRIDRHQIAISCDMPSTLVEAGSTLNVQVKMKEGGIVDLEHMTCDFHLKTSDGKYLKPESVEYKKDRPGEVTLHFGKQSDWHSFEGKAFVGDIHSEADENFMSELLKL